MRGTGHNMHTATEYVAYSLSGEWGRQVGWLLPETEDKRERAG